MQSLKLLVKYTGGANIGKRVNGSIIGFIHECGKEKVLATDFTDHTDERSINR
jgi:hypothetical protein